MTRTNKLVDEPEESEEEEYLVYEIHTGGGDVYLTINAGRNADVRVMSGQPSSEPPRPPKT